jgi:outer membrane protein OmpA-like peptidoglycan-associated protein
MHRLAALAMFALGMLLGACATPLATTGPAAPLPGTRPDAAAPDGQPAAPVAKPAIDWPAARNGIANALGESRDVVVSVRADGALNLIVPGADAFARDSTEPHAPLRATLDRIAAALAEPVQTRIVVIGHTDSMGRELHNLQLSIQRAEAVAEYLRTRGIALARLTADGRGEAEPIADNATEPGRATNRRVEIIVLPPE